MKEYYHLNLTPDLINFFGTISDYVVMSQEHRNQHEEAPSVQEWKKLNIYKKNCNGLKHKYDQRNEFIIILTHTNTHIHCSIMEDAILKTGKETNMYLAFPV